MIKDMVIFALSIAQICISSSSIAQAQDAQVPQAAILREIRETANSICLTVEQKGRRDNAELSLDAEAKLNNVISKIIGLNVGAAGKLGTEQYEGVLQSELASTLMHTVDCRRDVFKVLADKLLPSASDQIRPQPNRQLESERQASTAGISSNDAINIAFEFLHLGLQGSPPLGRISVPFCDQNKILSTVDAVRNEFIRPAFSPQTKVLVSIVNVERVSQLGRFGSYENCLRQRTISIQDYVVTLKISVPNRPDFIQLQTVVDWQSGSIKANF
jgi:hypothetical protein